VNLLVRGGDAVLGAAVRTADVLVADGRIAAAAEPGTITAPPDAEILDATGSIVCPGFIDLQCNGAAGFDLTADPGCIDEVAAALLPHGVTAWLPTVVTAPRSTRQRAIAELRRSVETFDPRRGSRPLGLHFEGPALSPEHPGAHTAALLTVPDDDEIEQWCRSGAVRMVTAAPELPGVVPMMQRLADHGVLVSAGHTGMSPEELGRAIDAGARYVTHLFNAMPPFHHRRPGPVGATLDSPDVVAGVICDGFHAGPIAIRTARRILGPDRVSLVSDASAALDAPLGPMHLGSYEIENTPTGPRLADGTLAGSAIGLDDAIRTYRAMTGAGIPEAVAAATSTPARLLGLAEIGSIRVGARGDLAVLDSDLGVTSTIIGGELAWKS
jgi:N-acetylglucosamine-6-phosphate deacetylase